MPRLRVRACVMSYEDHKAIMAVRVAEVRAGSREPSLVGGIVSGSLGSACSHMQTIGMTRVLGFPHRRPRSMSM